MPLAGAPLSICVVVCAAAQQSSRVYRSLEAGRLHPSLPMRVVVILDGRGKEGRSRRRRRL